MQEASLAGRGWGGFFVACLASFLRYKVLSHCSSKFVSLPKRLELFDYEAF